MAGWKHKKNITKIVGDEKKPVQLESGQVIINKKATAKHLDKLVDINEDGNSDTKAEVTNDGRSGGILKGKPHYDKNGNPTGGIPSIVDGKKKIEVEGEEFVVNKEASEKHWKELSKINQSAGNGVSIENPNPFDENPEEYSKGGKIEFNANHTPSKYILNYAEKIKTKYPQIWDLGGNIFGNQAYKNLKRVAQRGYWLDSEEWMYIKWRSYVARHKGDFRIEGVIAMLKWVDKVEKGWSYMKNLIQERIDKIEAKKNKMKNGGEVNAEELELRWDKKKNAIQELANNIHKLRYNVTKDLSSENEKEFLTALVISIIDKTGERVGNEESANNGHFGVTGFKKKHISVNGNKVTLKYIGKSGVEHETSFTDEKIANALKKAISRSASDFIFSSSDGFQIKANKINRYLSKYNVSAKDLRGYSANNWIIEKLNSIEAEKEPNKRKKQFNKILSSVAKKIGHGRATLKKHYLVPELENDFVENGKIVNIKEIGGEVMRKGGISNVNDKNGNIKFMEWYVDWYKKISDKINITFSLPNILLPFKEENVVILDLFEKIDQNIDAKQYLKEIVEKADEFSVTIYLEPTPRYKYFLKNIEKRKKISKDYLISYYQKFGFELTPNKNFMKRLPKSNSNEIGGELMKEGGVVTYKQKYNKKYGYDLDESHNLEEISKDTGVSIKGLQQIYNKGVGAFRTNPSSVRPNVKSEEQWAMARVYSAVMGGKTARIDAKELKMEEGGQLELGIKTEQEHKKTLEKIASGEISVDEAIEMTAKDHLKEDANYYTKLLKMEGKMANGGVSASYKIKTFTGEPSKLTYLQQLLVRTKAFKEFFGDWEKASRDYINDNYNNFDKHFKNVSKVMEFTTLEPRVCYHGTRSEKEFFMFDVSMEKGQGRPYAYFAQNKEYSQNFTEVVQREISGETFPFLYNCFLHIKTPFNAIGHAYDFKERDAEYWINTIVGTIVWDKYGTIEKNDKTKLIEKAVREQIENYIISVQQSTKGTFSFWQLMAKDLKSEFKYFLISYGYDGVYYSEEYKANYDPEKPDEWTKAYTIFSPKDIKLADGRNLNFNPMEADIRYEKGGELPENKPTENNLSKKEKLGSLLFGDTFAKGGNIKNEEYFGDMPKIDDRSEDRKFVDDLIKKMKL